eukprot:GHVT01091032.1.p1 GENE.GHVT01091032.1~~GHVT01091032.1.p1  ORF type:complete len:684 (+),score=85.72 GHVT01091032.1:606-2657(+)
MEAASFSAPPLSLPRLLGSNKHSDIHPRPPHSCQHVSMNRNRPSQLLEPYYKEGHPTNADTTAAAGGTAGRGSAVSAAVTVSAGTAGPFVSPCRAAAAHTEPAPFDVDKCNVESASQCSPCQLCQASATSLLNPSCKWAVPRACRCGRVLTTADAAVASVCTLQKSKSSNNACSPISDSASFPADELMELPIPHFPCPPCSHWSVPPMQVGVVSPASAGVMVSGAADNSTVPPGSSSCCCSVLVSRLTTCCSSCSAASAPSTPGSGRMTIWLWYVVLFGAMTGFLMGYDLSVVAVTLNEIVDEFDVCGSHAYCRAKEVYVAIIAVGACVGSLSGGFLADILGRPWALGLRDVFVIVGTFLQWLGPTFSYVLAGRTILGIGVGIGFMCFSTYVSEVAPANRRGQLVTVQEVSQCVGVLAAYILANAVESGNHRLLLGVPGWIAIGNLCMVPFLPESPRWLMMQAFKHPAKANVWEAAARKALVKLTAMDQQAVQNTIDAMRKERMQGQEQMLPHTGGNDLPEASTAERRHPEDAEALKGKVRVAPGAAQEEAAGQWLEHGTQKSTGAANIPNGAAARDTNQAAVRALDCAPHSSSLQFTCPLGPARNEPAGQNEQPSRYSTRSNSSAEGLTSISCWTRLTKSWRNSIRLLFLWKLPVAVAIGIGAAQDFIATNAVLYYSSDIFK